MTLTNLLNEVFVTLFADNQSFISALTPGKYDAPLTYSLELAEGVDNADKCIFIIEDSQLDIGLLIAVERNVNRILQIIADYLNWNDEQIAESIRIENTSDEEKEQASFDVYAEDQKPKKKGFFGKIGDWFKGLFKKKKDKQPPEQDYMMIYGKPHKLVDGKWVPCSQEEFDERMQKRHELLEEVSKHTEEAEENGTEDSSDEQNAASPAENDSEPALSPKEAKKAEKAAKKAAKRAAKEEKKKQRQEEKLRKKQEKASKKEADPTEAETLVEEPQSAEAAVESTSETQEEVSEDE